ncbi:MAG: hypothetical protein V4636_12940 [Pseudomonadota bacterium]
MPTTLPDLILFDGKTSTGAGGAIGNAQGMRYANGAGVNRNEYPVQMKVIVNLRDSTSGGTVTFAMQDSDDNSSYTTRTSVTLTIPTGAVMVRKAFIFKSSKPYVRANVTASSGGSAPTVDSYCTYGSLGQ